MKSDVVLIVEDEEASREMLEEFLTLERFRVKVATDGLDALEKLDDTVSVILLDLLMPRMTGWELIDRLTSEGKIGTRRVIVTTSAPQEAPGGFLVMRKPIDLEELVSTLKTILASGRV